MSSLLFGIYSRMGDGRIWRLWLAWSVTRKLSRRPKLASWTWRRVCVSFVMFYAWRPIEKGADELASKSFNIQCTHVGQLTAAAFTWYVDFMVLSSVAKWRAVSCIVYIINTVSWIKKLLEHNAVFFFWKRVYLGEFWIVVGRLFEIEEYNTKQCQLGKQNLRLRHNL